MKEFISEALSATGFKMEELTALESVFFRKKILEKFSDGKEHRALWEHTNLPDFAIRELGSWKWLDEFLQQKEFYLFFDTDDDPIIYIFLENQSIGKFMDEFPVSVFYITNENLDYLISYNDSDYLVAAGSAEEWLRHKAAELSKSGWKDMDGNSY